MATREGAKGFTKEERAAMKERARELKAAASGADGERAVLAKIDGMPDPDRSLGKRLHAIVRANAPTLVPRLWYGMPAYALPGQGSKEGKIVCHFQDAAKFKTRYATFGFSDSARLDDGAVWPVAFALKQLTPAVATMIGALVKKAVKAEP